MCDWHTGTTAGPGGVEARLQTVRVRRSMPPEGGTPTWLPRVVAIPGTKRGFGFFRRPDLG